MNIIHLMRVIEETALQMFYKRIIHYAVNFLRSRNSPFVCNILDY